MTNVRPLGANPHLARILAIAILVTLLVGIGQWVVQPILRLFSDQWQQNTQLEMAVSRYSMIIANKQRYKDSLSKIEANPLPQIFYSAPTTTSLGALIQNDVRELVMGAGGSIDSMQSLQSAQENGVTKVGVSLTMRIDTATLARLLRAIGNHGKLLRIDNITLRAPEIQPPTGMPMISLKWDIIGYGTSINRSTEIK